MSSTTLELETLGPAAAATISKPEPTHRRPSTPGSVDGRPSTGGRRPSTVRSVAGVSIPAHSSDPSDEPVTKSTTALVILSVTLITGVSPMLAGLVTVAIPQIAHDTNLQQSLLLWPASIYALVCGCTLLLFGTITDVVGARFMYLFGCFLQSAFTLACGLAQTGTQIIVFRALGGLAISMCLPSAVSIVTGTFPTGKRRNIAFASMGGGQPIGFAIGLTVGGVVADTIGWRWGFYIGGIINSLVLVTAAWSVPKSQSSSPIEWRRFLTDIDWFGVLTVSGALAGLSYVFAALTSASSGITEPVNATLLATSLALIPIFVYHQHRQVALSRPALIPTHLWRNKYFTTTTLAVFLTWASFNASEQLLTFYFQYTQELSALQSAVRFLPGPLCGALTNVAIAFLVKSVTADKLVICGAITSILPPLLMAIASPQDSYWSRAFPAVALNPVGADVLFTISNLVITSSFSSSTQALAGGVFNTVAQVGKSVGLALTAVIANSVTRSIADPAAKHPKVQGDMQYPPGELMQGYRAAFWFCFALALVTLGLSAWGLHKVGKVGEKRD